MLRNSVIIQSLWHFQFYMQPDIFLTWWGADKEPHGKETAPSKGPKEESGCERKSHSTQTQTLSAFACNQALMWTQFPKPLMTHSIENINIWVLQLYLVKSGSHIHHTINPVSTEKTARQVPHTHIHYQLWCTPSTKRHYKYACRLSQNIHKEEA